MKKGKGEPVEADRVWGEGRLISGVPGAASSRRRDLSEDQNAVRVSAWDRKPWLGPCHGDERYLRSVDSMGH